MSKLQKAALAKGRAALARLRKVKIHGRKKKSTASRKIRFHAPEQLEPIIIKGGSMARRRTHKRRKTHAVAGALAGRRRSHKKYSGALAGTRRRRHSARRYSGISKFDVVGIATDMVGVGVGAVGGSFITSKLPITNAKLKALVPIVIGIGIGMTKLGRNRFVKSALAGSIAVGTLSLVKQFFPSVPLLTGADDAASVAGAIDNLADEEKAMLGYVLNGDGSGVETYGTEAPLSPASY